jgi:hypothetical protein
MNIHENAINEQVQARDIAITAAKRQTAPLLRKGWSAVVAGWILPAIPMVGLLGFPISFFAGLIVGAIAASRGNAGGGIVLMLTGFFGTMLVGILWVLIYLLFGATLMSL